MSIQYALYKMDAPVGRKNNLIRPSVRIIAQATKDTQVLCKTHFKRSIPLPASETNNLLQAAIYGMDDPLKEKNRIKPIGLGRVTLTFCNKESVHPYGKNQFDNQIDAISYCHFGWIKNISAYCGKHFGYLVHYIIG